MWATKDMRQGTGNIAQRTTLRIPLTACSVSLPRSGVPLRGLTLIDTIVGVAVMTLVFLAIFGAFRLSIELVFSTKAKTGAVSLMTERVESLRSLPYGAVGTVGGIPAGAVPQVEQVSLNGIPYTVRTLIQYTDAPEDGLDENDANGVTADYKTVKVEVLWSVKDDTRSIFAVTRVAPAGLETLEAGGTLKVSVLDAAVLPVSGATVHIVNDTTEPAIDVSVATDAAGSAAFPGTPEAGNYEITVSKSGHSTAGTYDASAANPNPNPAHVAVVDEQTTSISFFIDLVGSLAFSTFSPPKTSSFTDPFDDLSKVDELSQAAVTGGTLVLEDLGGTYPSSGTARSIVIAPATLDRWETLSFSSITPPGTALSIQLLYFDGAEYVPVPDLDLSGNGSGFTTSPVDLSSVSTATYPELYLAGSLSTENSAVTPEILDWNVSYVEKPVTLPNVPFDIHGSKTIGTNGANPVYKYDNSFTTDAAGQALLSDIEWDSYTATLTGAYDIAERCPHDIIVAPGQALAPYFYLAPDTEHSLRVYVFDGADPVADATVTVDSGAGSLPSSSCGQAYFGDLTFADYTVTVAKPGFETHQETITVFEETVLSVGLVPE